jgi:Outer membrane protein beta-barrel domain
MLTAALLLMGGPVMAEQTADEASGFIFGIGGGQINYEVDELAIDAETDVWKLWAGYRINRHLTLEAAYLDGGSAAATLAGVNVRGEVDMLQLSATGGWWFTDGVGAYVRAAWDNYDSEVRVFDTAVRNEGDEFGWGAGVQAVWDRALWRLEYETVEILDTDVTSWSLNIGWQF